MVSLGCCGTPHSHCSSVPQWIAQCEFGMPAQARPSVFSVATLMVFCALICQSMLAFLEMLYSLFQVIWQLDHSFLYSYRDGNTIVTGSDDQHCLVFSMLEDAVPGTL